MNPPSVARPISSSEKVLVEPLGKIEERCKLLETYCCWLGTKRGRKSALWAFVSKETFEASNEIAPAKKAKELGEHPEVLMEFIQGRTGELKISHLHYDNLLRKADLVFPEWIKWLGARLG